jgi:hypothetical protein
MAAKDEPRTSTTGPGEGARFSICGARAGHPRARELADQAHELLVSYATDVVHANRLCPFLHNVDTGLGSVVVVLDVDPDLDTAVAAIREAKDNVIHLLYPLVRGAAPPFERFGSKLADTLRRALPSPLVHATFHPELVGGTENAHRLVGLVRRAPDAFIQFIPPGMHVGGTVMAGGPPPKESAVEETYRRIVPEQLQPLLRRAEELQNERARRYGALAEEIANG